MLFSSLSQLHSCPLEALDWDSSSDDDTPINLNDWHADQDISTDDWHANHIILSLPETLSGSTSDEILESVHSLDNLPMTPKRGEFRTLSDTSYRLFWSDILIHKPHGECEEECAPLLRRDLTFLLLETCFTMHFLHSTGFSPDRSHIFLMELLESMADCAYNK